ncbi:MAG TPA: hypothetical protein VFW00_00305, partial [Rhodocyclaceae bacterium]|nr:hypothetical protein [Rhodocyclaceae bacterium]
AQNLAEGLIRMMLLNRIDYSIVFGSEYKLFAATYAKEGVDVASLPIEGQSHYVPVYIVAPRDAWGRKFIDHVNQLLRTYWNDSDFRASAFDGMDAAERDETKKNLRDMTPARAH